MTQAQRIGGQREADQGSDHPGAGAASRRRARDRVILTQPPPPRPTPRRPSGDDEEPTPARPTTGEIRDERGEELLAEIDDLIDGR